MVIAKLAAWYLSRRVRGAIIATPYTQSKSQIFGDGWSVEFETTVRYVGEPETFYGRGISEALIRTARSQELDTILSRMS